MTSARTTTRSSSRHLIAQMSAPVRRFIATEAASAALLVIATVIALLWANSPWRDSYDRLWHTDFSVQFGSAGVTESLQHWVNEGLMVFFFFLVGMEVRRELQMGELTQRNRLSVPTLAALAGLVVPALVYAAFNAGGPGAHGWGIAMATDTAFLLGVLALVGPRCPTQLRVFLLSLSVVDDIGALSAIAVFYSDDIDLVALGIAALCVLAFYLLTRWQVWRGPFYFAVGVVMWLSMEASGVSPTIGGVVLGLLVSAYPPRRSEVESAGLLTRAFRQSPDPALARQAKLSVERAISPNERIGALLVPWSGYVVVPVFALANAGVHLSTELMAQAVTSPITIGVFVALVVGKFLGVGVAATAAVRLRLGQLPPGVDLRSVWGGAVLSGLGFTVSLFVTDLAFDDPELQDEARVGILAAAVTAAVLGAVWFRLLGRRDHAEETPAARRLDPPVDPARDHVRGSVGAPLELVEFGDVECPFCGRATGVLSELRRRFGDDLRYVFRHLPLPDVHPHAELAAEAVEAAGAQGAFWAMHDRLFAHQDQLEAGELLDHAAALGLDLGRFARELGDGTFAPRVREDVASAEASGVSGTPTFFVNGVRHEGPTTTEALAAALLASDPRGPGRQPLPAAPGTPAAARGLVLSPSAELPGITRLPDGRFEETPDDGSTPRLTAAQLAALTRAGRRVRTEHGQVLLRSGAAEYDFFVILSGSVAIVEGPLDGPGKRVVAVNGPGRFLGGLNQLAGQRPVRSLVAAEAGEVVLITLEQLRALLARDRELGDLITRSFLLRRAMLIGQASGLRVVGDRRWPASQRLQAELAEDGIAHQWLDPAEDAAARTLFAEAGGDGGTRPIVIRPDGRVLVEPTRDDLLAAAGSATRDLTTT
ncbi:Putative cyclic nucleotide-binding protein [Modestobacter italicus]|uniref:Na(+)/H(+) antiporter NhaA n=1 Tax=Modestobacter italicus (strain DSM 44449 / CECT 9708 / BC 501) TaxID=2732864 RepID=I4F4W0_MODI5|nr:Na+/H+ antiporter NhaA [Modestobacter marinus]CCH90673.1 Putative cyclic nucleotide-binding protein [Modestobacter marinus]